MAQDLLIIVSYFICFTWNLLGPYYNYSFEYHFIYVLLCLVFSTILTIDYYKKTNTKDVCLQTDFKYPELNDASTSTNDNAAGDVGGNNIKIFRSLSHAYKDFGTNSLSCDSFFIDKTCVGRNCREAKDISMPQDQASKRFQMHDTLPEKIAIEITSNLSRELPEIGSYLIESEEQEIIDIFETQCVNNNLLTESYINSQVIMENSSSVPFVILNEKLCDIETKLGKLEKENTRNDNSLLPIQTANVLKSDNTFVERIRMETPPNRFNESPEINRLLFEVEEQEIIDIFEKPCINKKSYSQPYLNNPFNRSPVFLVNPSKILSEIEIPSGKLEKDNIRNDNILSSDQTVIPLESHNIFVEKIAIESPPTSVHELSEINNPMFEVQDQEPIDTFRKPSINSTPSNEEYFRKSFPNSSVSLVNPNKTSGEIGIPSGNLEKENTENEISLPQLQTANPLKSNEKIANEYLPISVYELFGIDNPVFQVENEELYDTFEKPYTKNSPFDEEYLNNSGNDSTSLLDNKVGKRGKIFKSLQWKSLKNIRHSQISQKCLEMKHWIQQNGKRMKNVFKKY